MPRRRAFLPAALAALLLVPAAIPALADGWSPLGLSLATPDRNTVIGAPSYDCDVQGFRLGVFGAANARMRGLSLGVLANGFWNSDVEGGDGDVAGIQAAGVFNDADSARYGVLQAAGAVNILRKSGSFLQAAGLYNGVYGDGDGIQLAGFGNKTFGAFRGVQVAGVFNAIHDGSDFCGVQIAAVNYAGGTMNGAQLGVFNDAETANGLQIGAINYVDKDLSGFQIGAINLVGAEMTGFQIGAINFAEKANGVQIGAFNVAGSAFAGIQIGALNVVGSRNAPFSGVQIGAINGWTHSEHDSLPFLRIYF